MMKRSDSDLHTFGFLWRAWNKRQAIAEAPLILEYLHESASAFGIDKHMLFEHYVETANWSSADQEWKLDVTTSDKQTKQFRSSFLIFCTGYYVCPCPFSAAPVLTISGLQIALGDGDSGLD
jgi:cation diffusion facilitator CzcD-associated flavoprotein CzcO